MVADLLDLRRLLMSPVSAFQHLDPPQPRRLPWRRLGIPCVIVLGPFGNGPCVRLLPEVLDQFHVLAQRRHHLCYGPHQLHKAATDLLLQRLTQGICHAASPRLLCLRYGDIYSRENLGGQCVGLAWQIPAVVSTPLSALCVTALHLSLEVTWWRSPAGHFLFRPQVNNRLNTTYNANSLIFSTKTLNTAKQ
ncbi:uncharacterized protein LOC117191088 [Drosophila miranda]|uniref:uncharacterized protein LOC117191088 n=1 Tax=Drosophila miranda TaxID=7229 RepID=UPI00143F259F|nr:uncharacterized protein LOC117191088 [Drosophila miranda]